ncbi:MAG: O-phosphoserine--tRNA ligase [Candidatus Hydrothermarchaeota archaeon]|nr:MAG: O-phosphoserine--tRNA ligase [Candidatus Hydrothermarchaeota archaeon]
MWNPKKIEKLAKKDFERAWIETKELLPEVSIDRKYPIIKPEFGKPHPIFETIEKLRQAYLRLGFEEVVNPVFIEDKEVKRQFGPEALAVLDRCYYLAGLPRPDIGLSDEKIEKLKKLGISIENREALQKILHEYKKGKFGGDDLIYKIAEVLNIDDALATKVIDRVFPEFKKLAPEASSLTLRSHMTSGWFLTLQALVKRKPLPIKLFSIDRCFRREQREDETHLKTHHSASCVLVKEDVTIEDGKVIAEGLLSQFGFTDFKFKLDEKRSKYYAPDTQTEVYAYNEKTGWVEVATFGIYSPVALSRYKITYPVMNLGLGVERLAMVLYGYKDVRKLVYPQFYEEWRLSDREIASMIRINRKPLSKELLKIAEKIVKVAEKHAKAKAPCEFLVYKGDIIGKEVEIKLVEREEDATLLGPSWENVICVENGNIYGVEKNKAKGVVLPLRYIDGIAFRFAYEIEQGILSGKDKIITRVGMVKSLSDVNLTLNEVARRYIQAYEKTIDIRGPLFATIETKVNV